VCLLEAVAGPLAGEEQETAHVAGMRLVAIDGLCLDVPATAGNGAEFGCPGNDAGPGPFPQVRVVGFDDRYAMPRGERADLRPSAVLSREQPLERGRIRARHVEDLLPASRPCHHRDRAAADSERRSHQGQRSCSGLTLYGSLADPDHQGLTVVPAHAGTGRSGPDPDNDTHPTSVRPHAAWWSGAAARTGPGNRRLPACGVLGWSCPGRAGYASNQIECQIASSAGPVRARNRSTQLRRA